MSRSATPSMIRNLPRPAGFRIEPAGTPGIPAYIEGDGRVPPPRTECSFGVAAQSSRTCTTPSSTRTWNVATGS